MTTPYPPEGLPAHECDDEPKLTAEEWEALAALSGAEDAD